MPTARKQKKARKSREVELLSDIKNLDIMLGGNHLEILATQLGDRIFRNYNALEDNEEDSYPNSRGNRSSNSANHGHSAAGTDSSDEFNRILGELNLRISREMDEVMNSGSVQIQRANNDAISNQVLP